MSGTGQGSRPANLAAVLSTVDDLWSPRVVARFNDYEVRVAKFHGEYVWHAHPETDELFLVLAGELTIHLREPTGERRVTLAPGEVFVVPRGTEHKPVTTAESHILMLDPTGTVTTGTSTEVPDHIPITTGRDATGA